MPETPATSIPSTSVDTPLIFISHDTRDAPLAEAFSKLLKSVSAGILKSFRSSDKTGNEGIEFGDEWYKRLMERLEAATDVVCLLTDQSLARPWILYEAGVAKGKLATPVHGLALGVPLSRVSVGPFYQFQNSDDSADSLSKLVFQLCRRIPGLEPDSDVVADQVNSFKVSVDSFINSVSGQEQSKKKEAADTGAVAKVLEEMKLLVRELSMQIERRMIETSDRYRSRRPRRIQPMMLRELTMVVSRGRDDSIGILVIASLLREDFPWLYEMAAEAYREIRSGDPRRGLELIESFKEASQFTAHGPFMDELGPLSKEMHVLLRDVPMILEEYMLRGVKHGRSKIEIPPVTATVHEAEADTRGS